MIFRWDLPLNFIQRQIALGAADVPGEDHVLLSGLPRVVPAGFA